MTNLAQTKPSEAEGISRATWFRRQKAAWGVDAPDGRTRAAKAAPAHERRTVQLYTEADLGRPLTAQEREWDRQLDAIEDRGGVAEWNGNGYSEKPRSPVKALTPYRPATPPRSMFACGGKAGRGLVAQGRGAPLPPDQAAVSTYTRAVEFERNATASTNLLAKEVADLKHRVTELEQERAEQPTFTNNLANGLLGLFVSIATAPRHE